MADHNDPNAVNTIFSDVDVSAADLYDIFGFPSNDTTEGEKVVIALTFSSTPQAGTLDPDMLYRIRIAPDTRIVRPKNEDHSLDGLLKYVDGIKNKYESILKPFEVRVSVDKDLEDLTGNSIGRPFEVDVFDKVERKAVAETVALPFRIGTPKP